MKRGKEKECMTKEVFDTLPNVGVGIEVTLLPKVVEFLVLNKNGVYTTEDIARETKIKQSLIINMMFKLKKYGLVEHKRPYYKWRENL